MAHYYVDSITTGTFAGDSPANAAINITSLTSVFTASYAGSRIWVRRNWVQGVTDTLSMAWGPIGIGSTSANSHAMNHIIGWPNSGDMFYEERPAAGISAGWDSDTSVTWLWPTITLSGTSINPNGLRSNYSATNFTLAKSVATITGMAGLDKVFPENQNNAVGAVAYIYPADTAIARPVLHLLISTQSSASYYLANAYYARKITLGSSCTYVGSLGAAINLTGAGRIEEIHIATSSIGVLFNFSDVNLGTFVKNVGRVYGFKPHHRVSYGSNNSNTYAPVIIDDYFGYPKIEYGHLKGETTWVSTIGVAVFSGQTAMETRGNSVAPTYGISNRYISNLGHQPQLRARIDVTSGTKVTLRNHIACVNAGSLDFQSYGATASLRGLGGRTQFLTEASSGIRVGSAGLWTGSLTGVQSYYMLYAEFVPAETGQLMVDMSYPAYSNLSSGTNLFYSPFIEVGST